MNDDAGRGMNNASAGEDLEFRYGAIITKLVPVKCGCAFTGGDWFWCLGITLQ